MALTTTDQANAYRALETELGVLDWDRLAGLFALMGWTWRNDPRSPDAEDLRAHADSLGVDAIRSAFREGNEDYPRTCVSSGRLSVTIVRYNGDTWDATVAMPVRHLS